MADAPRDRNFVPAMLGVSNSDGITPLPPHVDSVTNRLLVDSTGEESGHSSVGDGTKTITSAGTRVQLSATSIPCKRVFIQSHESNGNLANGGLIVVGNSTVVAASATRRGLVLYPTQGDWFKVSNLNLIYLDSTDNGAIVHFFYEN